jgi:hypothetical protein
MFSACVHGHRTTAGVNLCSDCTLLLLLLLAAEWPGKMASPPYSLSEALIGEPSLKQLLQLTVMVNIHGWSPSCSLLQHKYKGLSVSHYVGNSRVT